MVCTMQAVAGTGGTPRRQHEKSFKTALVEQCLVPGASVAAVALAGGVNANLLFNWGRNYLRSKRLSSAASSAVLLPVHVAPGMDAAAGRSQPLALSTFHCGGQTPRDVRPPRLENLAFAVFVPTRPQTQHLGHPRHGYDNEHDVPLEQVQVGRPMHPLRLGAHAVQDARLPAQLVAQFIGPPRGPVIGIFTLAPPSLKGSARISQLTGSWLHLVSGQRTVITRVTSPTSSRTLALANGSWKASSAMPSWTM